MRHSRSGWIAGLLAGLAVVGLAGSASAQSRTTGGMSGSSSGSFGSSSSSSGFGSSGSSSSGSFTGSTTFGSSTGTTGRSGTGSAAYGQSAPYGSYYANPLALGVVTSGTGATATGSGSKYLRAYPVPLSFGQSLYTTTGTGTATVTRGGLTGGLGSGTGSISTSTFAGASTPAGMRRAPTYLTEPAFDQPAPIRGPQTARADLQAVIDQSSRLPSRGNIRVTSSANGVVVLRGQVRDARERRLAESIVRLSPGVWEVRNQLRVRNARR